MARVISKTQVSDPESSWPSCSFLELSFIKPKTTIFSLQREIIITSLFRKVRKVSRNDFKIAINGISGRLGMCKKYYFGINPYLSTNKKFIPCCTRSVRHVPNASSATWNKKDEDRAMPCEKKP